MQTWVNAICQVADELATTMLGFSQFTRSTGEASIEDIQDSKIKLAQVGDDGRVMLGVVTDEISGPALARALLGMEADEEIDEADIDDALGEIANMIAGGVKIRVDQSLKIGVPAIAECIDSLREAKSLGMAQVQCDDVSLHLVVALL